ncbi:hypothetical protein LguiB_022542 [Lonicera macranthoides]
MPTSREFVLASRSPPSRNIIKVNCDATIKPPLAAIACVEIRLFGLYFGWFWAYNSIYQSCLFLCEIGIL